MKYLDEELLEAKRELEYQKHTTLETGMYAGENLITFTYRTLPDSKIRLPIPDQFVVMPDEVKDIKYPSKEAPSLILTSLDSTVNICFNILPFLLKDGELMDMSRQFQNALHNINPSVIVRKQTDTATTQGNEMTWFEYKGYQLDGQSYNRVYLIRLRKTTLHAVFCCREQDQNDWKEIVEQISLALEEEI